MAEQNLCNYSKEEICNALKLIKEICQQNVCSVCPFGKGVSECLLQEGAPASVNIVSEEVFWRALK